MRKLVSAVLLMIIVTQAAGAYAYPFLPAEGILRVNAYLREEPSTQSRKIRTVEQDTSVTILEFEGSWAYVQAGKSFGYIRGDLFYDTTKMESDFMLVDLAAKGQSSQKLSTWLTAILLRYGMNGEAVKQLQEALVKLGFDALTINGVFDKETEDMVKAFQKVNGLKEDGIVGEETRTKLDDALRFYYQMNPVKQ